MNVLAVRQDNNGDVLLAGPAIRALAAGASRLTLLCGPSGRAAAEALPGVDHLLCFEAAWIEANPRAVARAQTDALLAAVAERHIERAVIFTSYHQSPLPAALLLRLAGVREIAAISEDYPGSLLDVRHRGVPDDAHEVERALSLARAAGFTLPPNDEGRLAMRIGMHNPAAALGRYVVVHPGATVPARAWSAASNRALVRALAARGRRVVVTGGHGERELCAAVAGDDALNLAGRTDFATLGAVIAGAAALVVGNTGAAHVAAAVGTPTVSLFAPTIPAARFRPWMVDHVLLGNQEIACAGCRARRCPREDQSCLSSVGVDDVLAALRVLENRPLGRNAEVPA
jgi:ADP-heptose:LPS heptosyltransferase